jgi:succinate-semialdehyde dehydrogenase / glutarate-semialdehyde dehydrogenase
MSSELLKRIDTRLMIGGDRVASGDGSEFEVIDPATGEVIAMVASGTPEDAVAAVAAAHDAGPAWAATPPRVRGELLRRSFEMMIERRDEIAEVIVLESGKSWNDAIGEVNYAAEFYRWFSEEAVRIDGGLMRAPAGDKHIITMRQPIGVAVLVTPWNFPAAMATRKIGPALAAGCTVVLKPASDTPLTALLIAQLMEEAGVPAGVVNVLPSRRSGATVGAMLADQRTRKVSFTGSTEVGVKLLEGAAQNVLKASMELGGNAPFLVFADSDLDAAVEGAMIAKMRNGGESCIAANRFLVEEPIVDAFSDALAARMAALKVGPGMVKANDVGPVINQAAREEIGGLVEESIAAGAKVLTGGGSPDGPGYFYLPTVIRNVRPDAKLLRHEIFGPVAPIVAFNGEEEGIRMANDTEFGLASYVYTGDFGRAMRVAEGIDAGVVGVNRGFVSDPAAPFGGTKLSGLGREGSHDGLLEFLETKYIAAQW